MRKIIFLIGSIVVLFLVGCSDSVEDKADKLYTDGKVEEAIVQYEQAIAEGSESALNKLALLYANEHQEDKSITYYLESYKKGNVEATQILANMSLKNEKYDDVVKYLKPLADQNDKSAIATLGNAYYKLNDFDNAIDYLLKDEDNVYNRYILGLAYYAKGDLKKAEDQWRKAVDMYPSGGINSYHKLLELYKEQNRMDDYKAYEGKY